MLARWRLGMAAAQIEGRKKKDDVVEENGCF